MVKALLYGLLLALPVSALAARCVPMATVMRYAVTWIVIFGVGLLAVQALT